MYGISTDYKISYIDCLFLCVSSMAVNGLATVDLSTLSVMQQVLMFWQMLIGSLVRPCPYFGEWSVAAACGNKALTFSGLCLDRHDRRPAVSLNPGSSKPLYAEAWLLIDACRHFFRERFKHVIQEQQRQSLLQRTLSRVATTRTQPLSAIRRRFSTIIRPNSQDQPRPVRPTYHCLSISRSGGSPTDEA